MSTMKVKKLNDNAIVPNRVTPGSAGLDLYSTKEVIVRNGQISVVPTGISVELPPDTVGFVWPRSGLALKNGLDVLAGVVDCDYRGEIMVVMTKQDKGYYTVNPGQSIAQLVIQPVTMVYPKEVESIGETFRGESGFGSSDW